MHRSLVVCTAILLLMAAKKSRPEKSKTDQEEFQGNWIVLEGSLQNGKPLPTDLVRSLRITFAGGKIIIKNGDTTKEGTFSLDPEAKPKAITIHHSDGKTKPSRGIYVFDRGLIKMLF